MRKHPLTKYGKKIKMKLIEREKTQEWLMQEIRKRSNLFVDCKLLNNIMTGKTNSSVIPIINEILGIE